jgi:hypothetical protein
VQFELPADARAICQLPSLDLSTLVAFPGQNGHECAQVGLIRSCRLQHHSRMDARVYKASEYQEATAVRTFGLKDQ